MEDFEELKSDCSVDSNELPPMPPLMKLKGNVLLQPSRQHGQSSVPPFSESNIGEENTAKASCMRSASLENREDTSNTPPEDTSSIFPVSPPPLIKQAWNTILSARISNRQPAFNTTHGTDRKSERDEATSSAPSELEDVENRTSAFSAYDKRISPMKPSPQFKMDVLTPDTESNTGVSAGRTREAWEQPDSCAKPVEHRRPVQQISDSTKVMAQSQNPCKRSKCKTSQRCQFCKKEFKNVSHLRDHERIHTGDRPFKCDVCGMSFTQSSNLCTHKRTHTGDRPFKCDVCGMSFSHSCTLCVHKRAHTGERPHKCKTCGASFTESSGLRRHGRIHSGERPFTCKTCGRSFNRLHHLRYHERIHTGKRP